MENTMTLALIGNEIVGLLLLVVVLGLLAGAIMRSRTDERRLAHAARRRQTRARRRATSTARPGAGWTARPEGF
jgi:Tfp pilus assembly protein PilX